MAKDITILGASYSDVPAVVLPQTGGGIARFDDVTVTTATAEDVAQGKVFVASDGTITTGTATGGGGGTGGVHMDADGYLVLDDEAGEDTLSSFLKSMSDLEQGLRYQELPTTVNLSLLTKTLTYALADIKGCKTIVLPVVTTLGNYTFADNKSIETYDIGASSPSSFTAWMFSGSSSMKTLILRKQSIVGLANVNVLNETCFASNGDSVGGTLYVPSSLISSYQSATNWSTILGYEKNQILAIEGSYYETHYADGTEIPT